MSAALGATEAAASGIVRKLLAASLITDVAPTGTALLQRCTQTLGSALDNAAHGIGVDPRELANTVRTLHHKLLPTATLPQLNWHNGLARRLPRT